MDTDVREAADLMRASFAAVAARDVEALATLWDDQSVDAFVALGIEAQGEAQLREFFTEFFAAVPDLEFEVEEVHPVDAHTAVGQWHLRGTFSGGPFQGIEPTGRPVDLRGVDVMRFADGKLRRNDVYYDGLSFARQIGLLPGAGSPGDRAITEAFNGLTRARRAVSGWLGR
jgi:steroid delta-isomerase-like uncharacterized protein